MSKVNCSAVRSSGLPCTCQGSAIRHGVIVCGIHATAFDEWQSLHGTDAALDRIVNGRDSAHLQGLNLGSMKWPV
jgi:hypothetical protein